MKLLKYFLTVFLLSSFAEAGGRYIFSAEFECSMRRMDQCEADILHNEMGKFNCGSEIYRSKLPAKNRANILWGVSAKNCLPILAGQQCSKGMVAKPIQSISYRTLCVKIEAVPPEVAPHVTPSNSGKSQPATH